ncbi:MAG: Gfo/Idh/MocA family oxidoreductase [Acidobacteria bacterium]|nr:Gfo/Idh/MocA family oxidoreductase [Acidobacteriota bacterium]
MSGLTRRELAAAAGFSFVAPGDRLNIAGVGVGGMGANYLSNMESENIAVLCDVDDAVAAKTFAKYPDARRYRDFRAMLDKEKNIDAVVVGTPDHTHAAVALAAMQLGKHVYCAKPMTRTIQEARLLARTAADKRVATQMSVQSCASEAACATAEWVRAGAVGKVREVHVWSDRPIWPQAVARPAETVPAPSTLNWDLFLGPAPARPYHPCYHPFAWRGWYDFGTGALGDMGCHTLHVIVRALELGLPAAVSATSSRQVRTARPFRPAVFPETFPDASIVTWEFPGVRVTWFDGGLKPPSPVDLPAAGILFAGDKGLLLSGFTGGPKLLSEAPSFTPPAKTLPRTAGHYQEWIAACKGGKPASCEFGFGAQLTEIALLGSIAVRIGKRLEWDAAAGRFTNNVEANALIAPPYRTGWFRA